MEFLSSLLRRRFARAQVASPRNVGCFLRLPCSGSFCFQLLMYVRCQRQRSPESICYHGYKYKYFEGLNRVSNVTCQFKWKMPPYVMLNPPMFYLNSWYFHRNLEASIKLLIIPCNFESSFHSKSFSDTFFMLPGIDKLLQDSSSTKVSSFCTLSGWNTFLNKYLKGSDCKYRESVVRLKKSKILITCQKNTFGELSSKRLLKLSETLLFSRNSEKTVLLN